MRTKTTGDGFPNTGAAPTHTVSQQHYAKFSMSLSLITLRIYPLRTPLKSPSLTKAHAASEIMVTKVPRHGGAGGSEGHSDLLSLEDYQLFARTAARRRGLSLQPPHATHSLC